MTSAEAGTPPALQTPLPFPKYLRLLLLVLLFFYVLPFLLIRAPRFDQWSQSPFGRELEYGFNVQHLDADVVIFGDSTALYGIDPLRMSAALHARTFNLPGIQPSVLATHDLGLKNYLAHNRAPRLIVVYFTPWDLDFAHQPIDTAIYDGDEMLLRHGTLSGIAGFYRTHLDEFFTFPFKFYRVQSPAGLRYLLRPRQGPPSIAVDGGHQSLKGYPALPSGCSMRANLAHHPVGFTSAQELLHTYTTATTRVLVYLSPIAACSGAEQLLTPAYADVPAAPPRLLPPGDIVADGYFAHPTSVAVPLVTDQLIEAVRPLLPR